MAVGFLLIPAQGLEAMLAHASFTAPEECCGLLAGPAPDRVAFVYPLTNAQASPTSYTIDPYEHYRAWKHAESNGWDLIGAFHSHPAGPAHPSATDLELAAEPGWTYLIVGGDQVRAFRIASGSYEEVALVEI